MKTLHSVIEEEKKEFKNKFSYGGIGLIPQHRDGGQILMREVQEYVGQAMHKAALAERERCITKVAGYLLLEKGTLMNAFAARQEAKQLLADTSVEDLPSNK